MEGECRGSNRRVLVTFDVDGTLIHSSGPSSNRLHRRAFSHAFLDVFGIQGTIDAIQHHGQTDPGVIVNTLVHYGIPSEVGSFGMEVEKLDTSTILPCPHVLSFGGWTDLTPRDTHFHSTQLAIEKLPVLKSRMIEYARVHAKDVGEGLEVLPGVESLLQALSSRENVTIGLVTGNLKEIAWMKMEGLGIKKYFTVPNIGGFGSDHIDRGHLVKIAADRAEKLFPGGYDLRVHVGDTPNDIKAAEFGGALAIGVCTGIFSKEELEQASSGGAIVLADLCDSRSFMSLLGIAN